MLKTKKEFPVVKAFAEGFSIFIKTFTVDQSNI